jgi:hypothetical protein
MCNARQFGVTLSSLESENPQGLPTVQKNQATHRNVRTNCNQTVIVQSGGPELPFFHDISSISGKTIMNVEEITDYSCNNFY